MTTPLSPDALAAGRYSEFKARIDAHLALEVLLLSNTDARLQ